MFDPTFFKLCWYEENGRDFSAGNTNVSDPMMKKYIHLTFASVVAIYIIMLLRLDMMGLGLGALYVAGFGLVLALVSTLVYYAVAKMTTSTKVLLAVLIVATMSMITFYSCADKDSGTRNPHPRSISVG